MKVKLAKNAGFCIGVKKAVDIVFSVAKSSKGEVITDGPLIHNKHLIEKLIENGIGALDEKKSYKNTTLVIRAHGISPARFESYKEKGFNIVNATCPHVLATQKKIERFSNNGYNIIIIGDHNHAEVLGLIGFVSTQYSVVSDSSEAKKVGLDSPVAVLVQSTFSRKEYKEIVKILIKKYKKIEIIDTLCGVTSKSQDEVLALCREVDVMVVIGDKMSANTKRLAMLAKKSKIPVFWIEDIDELPVSELSVFKTAGVTAGTSTPGWIIDSVIAKLKSI